MMPTAVVKNRGGGWYEMPDGEKVRGIDNVLEAINGNGQATQHSWDRTRTNRLRFARKSGLQYGNERDVYKVAGYPTNEELEFEHYFSRYERQDIAGRIVDMPAETTWRHAPEIIEEGEEGGTEFTEAWEVLAKRLRIWHRLERTDRLARIGQYGLLFIGVAGTDGELKDEIESASGPDDILYLSSYHQGDATINDWVTDVRDERFGRPESYKINLSSGVVGFEGIGDVVVHHSRVIHIAEGLLTDEVYGRPALKRVINRLIDLEKITAATAEAYWQLADKILAIMVDPSVQMGEDDRDALGAAAEEIMHDLRRQVIGQGIDISWLGGDTPDPGSPADLYMMLISAASGFPKRILFGTETGERASEQDERQWMGMIKDRETSFAEPVVLRPTIDRLIQIGALPRPATGDYEVVWPNRFQLNESQEAELNKTTAETAKALTPMGGDPLELVIIDDEGNVILRTTEIDGVGEGGEIEEGEEDGVPGEEEMEGGEEEGLQAGRI